MQGHASVASRPRALVASEVAPRSRRSVYPAPFAARFAGREKRALGEPFGLTRFGVNLTRLAPGASSSLRHAHTEQDELHTDEGQTRLEPGMCAGFRAGSGNAHRLLNETDQEVEYLEIGDRAESDTASYPDDDLCARLDHTGAWRFTHKDGTPY
jgi:uncharacterized cupin superfamily protein